MMHFQVFNELDRTRTYVLHSLMSPSGVQASLGQRWLPSSVTLHGP